MISTLSGTIQSIDNYEVILIVGPIGFSLQVPQAQLLSANEQKTFFIYFHWNQEQGPQLFGFNSQLEKKLFMLIIGCSGIGPKIALTMLANMKSLELIKAVQKEDIKQFSAIPGIGTKKAEQLILHLKHKINNIIENEQLGDTDQEFESWKDITQALEALHYSRIEISQAMQHVREKHTNHVPFDQLLRTALSFLSKRPS